MSELILNRVEDKVQFQPEADQPLAGARRQFFNINCRQNRSVVQFRPKADQPLAGARRQFFNINCRQNRSVVQLARTLALGARGR